MDIETAIVDNLYLSILGRPADSVGSAKYVTLLKRGVKVATIAAMLINSPESRSKQITVLVQHILNRDPAPSELAAYLDIVMNKQWNLDDIACLLYDSTDFQEMVTLDSEILLAAINSVRATNNLLPYNKSLNLSIDVAQSHANTMAKNNIQSHDNAGDGKFVDRITASGYKWATGAEIIATGSLVNDAMSAWMSEKPPNDGHKKAILGPYTDAGCASAVSPTTGLTYYSCAFATLGESE